MSHTPCSRCGRDNPPGTRFCANCGASVEAHVVCASCHELVPEGNRFCNRCGAEVQAARGPGEGASGGGVVDGVWERGASEFIRRVEPEDARTFLGNRVVRVPPGSVGVVVENGAVAEILPPGERTTLSVFERVARFFGGRERTAFYVVDTRPIPVPFTVRSQATPAGQEVAAQVVVSFSLPRGDKELIGRFIDHVLGDRPGFAAAELYDALRPDVTRIAEASLARLAGTGELRYPEAESEIRRALLADLGPRYGLAIDVSVTPLVATASFDVHLGTGSAPRVRSCLGCQAELPATLKFCDRCGREQPALMTPERRCASCRARIADGNRFCNACGEPFAEPAASTLPLFTSDGKQVELDLVLRVQGRQEDFALDRVLPSVVAGAAQHLRGVTLASLSRAAGFSSLEAALFTGAEQLLAAAGLSLIALAVIDVREKTGQWLLGARADLDRSRAEAQLGREWLATRAEGLDLEQLTLAQALKEQQLQRDAKLQATGAELDDRRRHQQLATDAAALDVADARRAAQRDLQLGEAAHDVERASRRFDRERETDDARHVAELSRQAMALEAERTRLAAETGAFAATRQKDVAFSDHERRARLDENLADHAEARQIEKLRAMAEIDSRIAAQDQAHDKDMRASLRGLGEREMIAIQATELARTEGGGAAWAQALSSQEATAQAERHATEMKDLMRSTLKDQLDRMQHLTDKVMDAGERGRKDAAAAGVYESSMEAMSNVAAARAQPTTIMAAVPVAGASPAPPEDTVPCAQCSAPLRRGARYCGVCGKEQTREGA